MRVLLLVVLVIAALAAVAFWQRDRIETLLRAQKAEWDHDRAVSDVYLPAGAEGPLPAILMRLPYGKTRFGEVRKWMRTFLPEGYAVVVQDMRGRYASEGVWAPYPDEARDGAATLDWITAQGWSDGKVGTIGCSALGETQLMLATERHPAHRAMIPMGAGGAIGTLDDAYGFFGFFEGGILNLASGFGWFVAAGGKTPDRMEQADAAMHGRVAAAFREAAGPGIVHLDASRSVDEVGARAWAAVESRLPPVG